MNVLVIPSNRPQLLAEFLRASDPVADWDRTIVVYDGPDCDEPRRAVERHETRVPIQWYCWAHIDRELGDDAWIISRKSSGIPTFGYLLAQRTGPK